MRARVTVLEKERADLKYVIDRLETKVQCPLLLLLLLLLLLSSLLLLFLMIIVVVTIFIFMILGPRGGMTSYAMYV